MKAKHLMTTLVLTSFLAVSAFAQDIHFSQFYESPLTMNPALSGMFKGDDYIEANYKNQWNSVSGNGFKTIAAEGQIHNIAKKWNHSYLSPGLSFYNDKSGDAKMGITKICFTLADGIFLNDNNALAAGIQVGWAQHSINTDNLEWGSQYNPNISSGYDPDLPAEAVSSNSISNIDLSAGLAWNYSTGNTNMTSNDNLRINAGIAAYHLNQPTLSFYQNKTAGTKLYMRYVGHALVEYGIPNTNTSLIPAVVYYSQGSAQEVDFGLKVRYILKQESHYTGLIKGSALDLGIYYRAGDSFIPMIQMEFGSYAIGISYDSNVSSLSKVDGRASSFELSLRFVNPNPFAAEKHQSMF